MKSTAWARFRRRAVPAAALLAGLGTLALGPAVLADALRSAAALTLEAAPFVLLTQRFAPLRRLAGHGGCCGTDGRPARAWSPLCFALGGALFGWPLACVRAGAAGLIDVAQRERAGGRGPMPSLPPGRRLATIACAGAAAALAVRLAVHLPAAGLAAGLAAGAFLPCALGSLLLAAAAAHTAPAFAAGIAATCGIASFARAPIARDAGGPQTARADSTWANCIYAAACALAAEMGGAGLVNPRFLPLLWLGAIAGGTTRLPFGPPDLGRVSLLIPLALIGMMLLPSAPPAGALAVDSLADSGPGDRIVFTGVVTSTQHGAEIRHWQIWCCLADAVLSRVPLRRPARLPAGTWARVSGTVVRTPAGLELDVTREERLPAPRDPYVYA